MMNDLTPHSVLRRAPNLALRLDSNNEFRVSIDGIIFTCGGHGLAILDVFSRPTTVAEAVEALQKRSRGVQDWMELTSTMTHLYRCGALREDGKGDAALKPRPSGFDAAKIHIKMLNDRTRTSSYLKAISEVVRPGDIVIDVGTGTGVLAVAAARAGAKRVYAIEGGHIADVAQRIFDESGWGDGITVVKGWSTQIELPERADVMISEIIGDDPFGEHVVEITVDAHKRLLKPSARVLPQRMKVYAMPLSIPEEVIAKHLFTENAVRNWREWYGISFEALLACTPGESYQFLAKSNDVRNWGNLCDPALIADVAFDGAPDMRADFEGRVTATSDGTVNGIAIYFELDLSPTTALSTHPSVAASSNSWHTLVRVLPEPLAVRPGDEIELVFRYRVSGPKLGCRLLGRASGRETAQPHSLQFTEGLR